MKFVFLLAALALGGTAHASSPLHCQTTLLQQEDPADRSSGYVIPDRSSVEAFDLKPDQEASFYFKIHNLLAPPQKGAYWIEAVEKAADADFSFRFSKKYFDEQRTLGDSTYAVYIREKEENTTISLVAGSFAMTGYLSQFNPGEKPIVVLTCTEAK